MEVTRDLKYMFSFLIAILGISSIYGFRGAVFEHAQKSYVTPGQPIDIIRANLEYYKVAAEVAKQKGVDVLVFPEYGIFPSNSRKELKNFLEYVPDPKVNRSNPCVEATAYSDRPILLTMSCMARHNGIIIVVNMGDIQPCRKLKSCPKDGVFQFNTNVAFDRDGTILAKYHKEHLFGEFGMDVPPLGKQDPTFETDVGRFAMFICFDLIFQRITEVAQWKGVEAILFPTMWFDSGPLYYAVEHFQAWAIGNNATLLAANNQVPGISTIGSGIMNGREGALVYTFNPDGQSKLLISDIRPPAHKLYIKPSIYIINLNGSEKWSHDGRDVGKYCSKKVLKPVKDIYKEYRCLEKDLTNFTLIKLAEQNGSVQACNNGMCCMVRYSTNDMKDAFYLGINNGTYNSMNRYRFAEEVCFLARCDGFKNKSCVTFPTRSKTVFNSVHMTANFSTNFIYPTVMSSGRRLVPKSQWKFRNIRASASIFYRNPFGMELLLVGMKGRPYDRDPPYVR